jgi:hypothetical protein
VALSDKRAVTLVWREKNVPPFSPGRERGSDGAFAKEPCLIIWRSRLAGVSSSGVVATIAMPCEKVELFAANGRPRAGLKI